MLGQKNLDTIFNQKNRRCESYNRFIKKQKRTNIMDTKELESKLKFFFQKCEDEKYPLESHCLREVETEFILEVKANWIDKMDSCSSALDILNNILWQTTDVETRKQIFAISILDSHEQPHCITEFSQDN
jgi:hypothetical protein